MTSIKIFLKRRRFRIVPEGWLATRGGANFKTRPEVALHPANSQKAEPGLRARWVRFTIGSGLLAACLTVPGCTKDTQNRLGRAVRNWTGNHGVLDIYAGEKLVKRFIHIEKLTTARATTGRGNRPYRFGYGVDDANFNYRADTNEREVYFEFSDYSTSYIFYEYPPEQPPE